MDISQAQKHAEVILGRNAEVRYAPDIFEYQVGLNISGEFVLYSNSNQCWEDALTLAKEIKNGKSKGEEEVKSF